ncbi:hypothetical protein E1A91_A12G280100v1 [Gossypium mustelinum]|uniref:PAR1 protein n=1 Tax=Gossypium mustelinum TaxID=34275 RepID=A0A5D2WZF0_GOSMU|nr:hypothetical protein E1A91_A12G280100v1 [Gossypium mustelinum]
MACTISMKMTLAILPLSLFSSCLQATLGEIICEHLDQDTCAYAVASTGKRCVLEKHVKRSGEEEYTCRTSEIEADKINNWIETDQCVKSCGLDRKSFGISSDSLLESRFTEMLCSPQCYNGCPNVIDLYFNLAAGEGIFLPKLCEAQKGNIRRGMSEIRSSGMVAPGPVGGVKFLGVAPAMAPY